MRRLLLLALVAIAFTTAGKDDTAYVFKHGEKSYIQAGGPLESVLRAAKRWQGEFIWVRRGGRQYLIRDAASLAEARAAFRELEALQPSHDVIEKRLEPVNRREQELDEQIDALSDRLDDESLSESKRNDLERKLREFEKTMRGVEEQMRAIEKEMEQLERKMDAVEEVAEKRLHEIVDRAIRKGVAIRVD